MRIHKILGVEPYERFEVKGCDGEFMLDSQGAVRFGKNMEMSAYSQFTAVLINHPERIIRKPRLTAEQIELLKAGYVLDMSWLAKDEDGEMNMYCMRPVKKELIWALNPRSSRAVDLRCDTPLASLVSWDDPEPLDIEQTLRDAGA
jgi:hypothetical protein